MPTADDTAGRQHATGARAVGGEVRTYSPVFAFGIALGLVVALVMGGAAGSPEEAALEARGGGSAPVPAPPTAEVIAENRCIPAMPLEERAAVVLVVGMPEVTASSDPLVEELGELGVGGVFLTGYNVAGRAAFADLIAALRAASPRRLLVTTDEELGRVSSFRVLFGPTSSPRTLAGRHTPEEMQDIAARLGRSLADLDVDVDFAPVADLDGGPSRTLIGDRSFSGDPEVATAHTLAFMRGLVDGGVLPTVKHFPGHGRATQDTHSQPAVDETSLSELRRSDLRPFRAAIAAGAPVVMMSHVTHTAIDPELPASVAPGAYELLRDLGFRGVAITDSVGMGAIHGRWKFPESAPLAIAAGADAVLATDGRQARAMRDGIVAAVTAGELPEGRLDEAAARVLTLLGEDAEAATCVAVDDFPTALLPDGWLGLERPVGGKP